MIKKIILTDAVFAPKGIPIDPKDSTANPIANNISPYPNLYGPEILYLLCHIFETRGANVII